MHKRALLFFGLLGLGGSVTGCPPASIGLCDDGACDPADASSDVPGDTKFDAPQDCDLSKDPKDSPKCIDDSVGVFVSPTGADANPGTKASPVATLGKALSIAGKPRIYLCEGTYQGSVDVIKTVGIFGGLKCDWSIGGAKPVVQADKPAYGLKLAAANISFTDVDVTAKGGTAAGESSIGIFAVNAAGTKLVRVKVTAGAGVAGTNGSTQSNYTVIGQSDTKIAGNGATGINGGGAHACTNCVDTKNSVGGSGGTGGAGPGDGTIGTPPLGGGTKGLGDPDFGGVMKCTTGGDGASPANATPGAASTTVGSLDATGWKPSSGTSGINGAPGQGGGGGGGGYDVGNAAGGGGGGGCGGCGGGLGTGGTGGGSSIALLVLDSTVTLTASELVSVNGGDGGKGAAGQSGQLGGFSGGASAPGCFGGTGGTGGAGGAGSGGAGGISVGIAYKGTKPTTDAATDSKITFGTKGAKGTGGAPGTNDGPDGVAQPVFQVP